MSDFDVVGDGMANQRLSDAEIEAMIEGASVDGAPAPLSALIASLREHGANAPRVPVSGALSEFVVKGTPATVTDSSTGLPGMPSRPARRMTRAVSALGVVPAFLLVGATMTAAAAGGAHLLGIVDVPLLPDRERSVVTPAPSELESPIPGSPVEPPPIAPPTMPHDANDVDTPTSTPNRTPVWNPSSAPSSTWLIDPGAAGPTLPSPVPVDDEDRCGIDPRTTMDPAPHAPDTAITGTDPQPDPCDPPATTPTTTPTPPTPTTAPPMAPPTSTAPAPPTTPMPTTDGHENGQSSSTAPADTGPTTPGARERDVTPTTTAENVGSTRTPEGT